MKKLHKNIAKTWIERNDKLQNMHRGEIRLFVNIPLTKENFTTNSNFNKGTSYLDIRDSTEWEVVKVFKNNNWRKFLNFLGFKTKYNIVKFKRKL